MDCLLHHKLDRMEHKLDLLLKGQGEVMADVSAANEALNEIDGEDTELVADYKVLLETISQLTTERAPTEAELTALTDHAAKIAAGFKALHEAESKKAPAPESPTAPPVVTPPAETPPAETPPAGTPPTA